jgi:preprotein translocase subunit SecE
MGCGRQNAGREGTEAAMANSDDRQGKNPVLKFFDNVVGQWKEFTQFLGNVRGEMRKVVTPSWKEVKATTTVVLIAVGLFGVFFFVVDSIFSFGLDRLLKRLGGM